MDNNNKKTPRKVHDINTQIEEENLWDLEDDWDDADEEAPSNEAEVEETAEVEEPTADSADEENEPETSVEEIVEEATEEVIVEEEEEEVQEEQLSLDEDLAGSESEPVDEDDSEPVEKAPLTPIDEFDLDDEEELEYLENEEPEAEETDEAAPTEEVEEAVPVQEPTSEDVEEAPTTSNDIGALVEPLKKLGLSSTEKIALSAIALLFVGLTLWGVIWLKQKNNDATQAETLELPIAGSYATVTEFSTFWKSPGKASGIKLGAVIVPAASITLDDESTSGALRIYFRNASQDSVGDPITISFQNGKFANGTHTVEVSASDGFHLKGDFHAYQMDSGLAWEVEVLEAEKSNAGGSSFKKLFDTEVSPTMR